MNRKLITPLAMATLLPCGAMAQAENGGAGPVTVTGASDHPWEMICHVLPVGGEESAIILSNGRPTFEGKNLHRISCDFNRSGKTPFVITIVAPGMKCPLKSDDASKCTQSFDKQAAGSFTLGTR